MKCPYCSREMECGTLRSRGGIFFLPDGEASPLFYTDKAMAKHNAVKLPPNLPFPGVEFPVAYACRACSKLLIEYDQEAAL